MKAYKYTKSINLNLRQQHILQIVLQFHSLREGLWKIWSCRSFTVLLSASSSSSSSSQHWTELTTPAVSPAFAFNSLLLHFLLKRIKMKGELNGSHQVFTDFYFPRLHLKQDVVQNKANKTILENMLMAHFLYHETGATFTLLTPACFF